MTHTFQDRPGQNEFAPTYGGIDWRALNAARLALSEELTEPIPIWFITKDGYEVQCTQENVTIYLNEVSDNHDAIMVWDARDNKNWLWFREDLKETFEPLIGVLLPWATIHASYYPPETMVNLYEKHSLTDIGDFVPEGWDE